MDRRPELDGLRGVAVLMVLLSHASNQGLHLVPGLDARGTGRVGVFLFFVLSSYLLTDQLLERGRAELLSAGTWMRYARRRLVRIYPAYALCLGLYLLLGGMGLRAAGLHLLLLRAEGHFWTIPVEALFYLALPPLVLGLSVLARPGLQLAALVTLGAAVRAFFPPDYPARAPDFRPSVLPFLPVFLAGSAVAVLARADRSRAPSIARARALRWLALAALGGVLLLSPSVWSVIVSQRVPHTHFHLQFELFAALWAVFLFALLRGGGPLRTVLAWRPLRWVGWVSYSAYLLHVIALAWATERVAGGHPTAAAWAFLALTLGAAWLSYRLVERPFMRLG